MKAIEVFNLILVLLLFAIAVGVAGYLFRQGHAFAGLVVLGNLGVALISETVRRYSTVQWQIITAGCICMLSMILSFIYFLSAGEVLIGYIGAMAGSNIFGAYDWHNKPTPPETTS